MGSVSAKQSKDQITASKDFLHSLEAQREAIYKDLQCVRKAIDDSAKEYERAHEALHKPGSCGCHDCTVWHTNDMDDAKGDAQVLIDERNVLHKEV